MESDVTQSAAFFRAWAWAESHRKQILWTVGGLLIAGCVAGFYLSQKHQKQVSASEALSRISSQSALTGKPAAPDAFQRIASEFPGTSAGERALLIGAARFFAESQFTQAETEFRRFLREHPGSDFAGAASLGVAASLEAQGKTDEALKAYKEITERRTTDPVMPSAKLSLARLYEAQGNLTQAQETYRQMARPEYGSLAQEAMMQLQMMMRRHPELNQPVTPPEATSGAGGTGTNGPVLQLQ
ncbi:MAG TPA: tetratricopeptide repeat protein [Verrucomicrobiae bacterium]|nr:tetratricopeptide repeat protein [Verrucomicrobiae bacterium]